MRNVLNKFCIQNKNIFFSFFRKSCRLCDDVEKFGRVGQATDDNIIRPFACWITKVTGTHSEYIILIAFPLDSGYANASRSYVIRTLPLLLIYKIILIKYI